MNQVIVKTVKLLISNNNINKRLAANNVFFYKITTPTNTSEYQRR
jgi:hypothetical protein